MKDGDSTHVDIEKLKVRYARRVKRFAEMTTLALKPHQLFPPRPLLEAEHLLPDRNVLVRTDTPVGSMGSCFAREIGEYLIENGFNYVRRGVSGTKVHGSAPWERVFSTACMRQEIERAFSQFDPELYTSESGQVTDPHRKQIYFDSAETADSEIAAYQDHARQALTDSKVFILTLGLSEVWFNAQTGKYYAEALPARFHNPNRDDFKLLSPQENVANLRRAVSLLKQQNAAVEIVLTVSPIPMRATFFPRSAVVSNNVSKASLIYAAHIISEEFDFVHYFPSYEIVQYLLEDPYQWDYRHVTDDAIEFIMSCFRTTFVDSA